MWGGECFTAGAEVQPVILAICGTTYYDDDYGDKEITNQLSKAFVIGKAVMVG